MSKNKFFLKRTMLLSTILSPIIVLSSCSSEGDTSINLINDFLQNNEILITPIKDKEIEILKYPAQLYLDDPIKSLSNFELTKDFQEILVGKNIDVKFEFSKILDGTKIEFRVLVTIDNNVIETTSIVSGFKTWQQYSREATSYLQNLNVIDDHKMKYTLKDFLNLFLPEKNQMADFQNILDINCPPGFEFSFNTDIKTMRYDFNNQKLAIGSFSSKNSTKNELSISIKNNFKNSSKPLYIFVVDDEGVKINSEDNLGINAEVMFINRTTDNVIRFNQKWLGKAVYGELDLSEFSYWELRNSEVDSGFFESNFITSIKLPKDVSEIDDRLFLSNKISVFDIPNKITMIHNTSFDSTVKFTNLLSDNLKLKLYYDLTTKTMDFSNINNPVNTLQELLNLLKLIMRKDELFIIDKIIINMSLFKEDENSDNISLINQINSLTINVDEVIFVTTNDLHVNTNLSLNKWVINTLVIPEGVLSINMAKIKKTKMIINRKINNDILKLVVDGTLNLENDASKIPGYKNNLNDYFDFGSSDKNIVQNLYLENTALPTDLNFNSIFKTQPIGVFNNLHIYNQTNVLNNNLINSITNSKVNVTRDMPSNLIGLFVGGHLNLENSANIFIDDFYKNIKYLEEVNNITKLTLPTNAQNIPKRAFYDINLSNVDVNFLSNILNVGDFAFYKSQLQGSLNMPQVTKIGQNAFSQNKLTSIDMPELTTLNSGSFQNNLLTSIIIPKITIIPINVFGDNKLKTLNLSTVSSIGSGAFQKNKIESVDFFEIPEITKISFDPGVKITIINEKLIPGLLENNIIDFGAVKETHSYSDAINQLNILLSKDTDIKVVIKEVIWDLDLDLGSTSSIKTFRDTNISHIQKLTINDSTNNNIERRMPNYMFSNIQIDEVVGLEHLDIIGSSAFQNCKIKKFNNVLGELTFSRHLKTLGDYSFQGNDITSLVFESGVSAEITNNSFTNNINLTKVVIPSSVMYVSGNAFSANKWIYIERSPFESKELPWILKKGELYFKEMLRSSDHIMKNIKTLNGLKIEKIKFSEDIYFIFEDFLAGLKNSNRSLEIDLSNILVINSNAFSGLPSTVMPGSMSNVIYNDISSGINNNNDNWEIMYNQIYSGLFQNIDKFKEKY